MRVAEAEAALGVLLGDALGVGGVPVRLVGAEVGGCDAGQVRRWVEVAEGFAEQERLAAAAGGEQWVAHWRKAVLFSAFPVVMGAVGRGGDGLGGQDFLPLVHHVVDSSAATVSDADLARIDGYIAGLLAAGRPVTLDGLVRWHGYAGLVEGLGPEPGPAVVGPVVEAAGLDGRAAVERVAEVRSLLAGLAGTELGGFVGSGRDRAEVVNWLVSMVQRRYGREHGGASMVGPVSVGDVAGLVAVKLPGAVLSWASLDQVVVNDRARREWVRGNPVYRFVRWVGGQPGVRVQRRLGGLYRWAAAYQRGRVQKMTVAAAAGGEAMPDAGLRVAAEVDSVWGVVSPGGARWVMVAGEGGAGPARLDRDDVKRLVWFRREWYADVRHRGYRGPADYGSMMLGVLGRGGEVAADDLMRLALVVRQAHEVGSQVKRVGGGNSLDLVVDRVVSGWRKDNPGERPRVPGVDEDHSGMVSAFHAIRPLRFAGELTAWLNGIVPGSKGAVQESVVNQKLVSLFGQALDDGSDIPVTVGGRTYDVRLWAVAAAPPQVQESSLIAAGRPGSGRFSGKGENRIYSYGDVAATRGALDGGFGDGGPMTRVEGGAGRVDVSATLGKAKVSGSRRQVAVAAARYQFLRIKEPLGDVDLPVAWAARVQDRATGAWKDFVWTGSDGRPRQQTVSYGVAEFMLPLTTADVGKLSPDLRDKLDPEYRVARPLTTAAQLPLWDVDHAVSRIQLADKVLAGMRQILTVEDYRFWKPVLEAHVTNDTLAVGLADILRPQGVGGFQQGYRVTLNRDGRHLSFSLSPSDSDRPISRVAKISEVSRSLETRFDRVRALVIKSLGSWDKVASWRLTLLGRGRIVQTGTVQGRYQWAKRHAVQNIRHTRAWLQRSKRLVGRLQVLSADFEVRVDVHHEKDGEVTASGFRVVGGYAHLMMGAAKLRELGLSTQPAVMSEHRADDAREDAVAASDAVPDVGKRWWTPGPGYGLTMDNVEGLDGVERLYDQIVPFLVGRGYLPAEALPVAAGEGVGGAGPGSAWELLQSFSGPAASTQQRTGAVLNRPGQEYANWRELVDKLSEAWLVTRGDDVFAGADGQPGVVMSFVRPLKDPRPGGAASVVGGGLAPGSGGPSRDEKQTLTIALSGELGGASRHRGRHPYTVQWNHTNIDTAAAKQAKGSGHDGAVTGSGDVHVSDAYGLRLGGGGQGSQVSNRGSGKNQSTAVESDIDGRNMPSSRYDVDIEWSWRALIGDEEAPSTRGTPARPAAPVAAVVTWPQPDELLPRPMRRRCRSWWSTPRVRGPRGCRCCARWGR
jgi:hypothetical protein